MAQIQISFSAHRPCYRELIEEFKEAHPMDTLEFNINFWADEGSMMCSTKCKEFFEVAEKFDQPSIRKDRRNAVQ